MKKALGIGEIVLDKSCVLNGFPKEDTKVNPISVHYSLGGPVAAALIVLSRLGVDCTLLASVGEDRDGALIIKKLAQEGIRLVANKKGQTKVNTYLINKKNGSRTGIKSEVKYDSIQTVPDGLLDCDIIIADRHETKALDFACRNKKKSTKLVIDPSDKVNKNTIQMIKQADYPVIPIEFLDQLPGIERKDKLKSLYNISKKQIVVTVGEMGSFIYNGKNVDMIDPLEVDAIDRLGAGDVFRAGIAWGALNNWVLKRSVKYANVVSGLQCTNYGNGTAIPTKEEIEKTFKHPVWKNVSRV